MRVWSLVVLASLAGALLSGCLGNDYSEPVPTWQPGYTWLYEDTATMTMEAVDDDGEETTTVVMRMESRMEVLNADAVVLDEPAYLVAASVRILELTVDGADVLTPADDDDALPEEVLASFCDTSCAMPMWIRQRDLASTPSEAGPFHANLQFPLEHGATWTTEAPAGAEEEGFDLPLVYEVTGQRERSAAGEAMRTIRIDGKADADAERRLKAELRKAMPEAELKIHATQTLDYAPRAASIVAMDQVFAVALSQGKTGASFDTRVVYESHLVDYVLDVKPPRSLEDFLRGQAAPLPPAEPWPFAVVASQKSLPAEPGAMVTVSVDDNVSQLQPGAVLRWHHQHVGVSGTVMRQVKAPELEIDASSPGAHRVMATVHDAEGRLRGVASVVIDAFTVARLDLDVPVGLPVTATAETLAAVGLGACTTTVQLESDAVARGTVRLQNGTQGVSESVLVPFAASVAFEPLAMGLYTFTWDDDVRAGALGATLEVHYGCDAEEPTVQVLRALARLQADGMGPFAFRAA